jgi:hypothetical protein
VRTPAAARRDRRDASGGADREASRVSCLGTLGQRRRTRPTKEPNEVMSRPRPPCSEAAAPRGRRTHASRQSFPPPALGCPGMRPWSGTRTGTAAGRGSLGAQSLSAACHSVLASDRLARGVEAAGPTGSQAPGFAGGLPPREARACVPQGCPSLSCGGHPRRAAVAGRQGPRSSDRPTPIG